MGEAPNLPASVNLARHIAECPNLFPEVNIFFNNHLLKVHNFCTKVFTKFIFLKSGKIKVQLIPLCDHFSPKSHLVKIFTKLSVVCITCSTYLRQQTTILF